MTADQARAQTHQFLLQSTDGEYQSVLKKIEEKVNKGEFSLYISSIHELVKAKLVTDGYTVTYNQGDYRDPREGSSYTISWK